MEEITHAIIRASAGPPGDAGLLSLLNAAGKQGWRVFAFRPGEIKLSLEHGKIQAWTLFAWRPASAIVTPNEVPAGIELAVES